MTKLNSSSVNVVDTRDEKPHSGGILHLMGSLFWGSAKRPSITEVTYDRDSNSYSGAEYL